MTTTSQAAPLRVMFADDHAVVREGLSVMLERAGISVVATFDTWTDCVAAYEDIRPDITLLDLNIPPDNDGILGLARILQIDPDAKVVVISVTTDPAVIAWALELGARGFIAKMSDSHELPQVVRDAAATRKGDAPVFDRRTASAMYATASGHVPQSGETTLSQREVTMLQLLAQGNSVDGVAKSLQISRATVTRGLTLTYKKLKAGNRSEALVAAARLGLISKLP